MATPSELYQAGQLSAAIEAAVASVKSKPTDYNVRGFLCELLCFSGDLDRADKQLDTLSTLEPQVAVSVALIRQLIRAEQARLQFYTEGRVPEFIGLPSDELQLRMQASIALRAGDRAEALRLLEQAEGKRQPVRGTCNGEPFSEFRDLDDLTSSYFEVFTSTGKYFWIGMEQVQSIEFHAPERPRDLLWRRATMSVLNGPDGEVFLPTLYTGTADSADDQVRLGRATDWVGTEDPPVRGLGLRTFLAGERDITILELETLEFENGSVTESAAE